MNEKKISSFIYLFLTILFLEIVAKKMLFNHIFSGLWSVILFSLFFVFIFTLLTRFFKEKTNKILLISLIGVLTLWFEIQYIFYALFNIPFSFTTLFLANQAVDFANIAVGAIIQNMFGVILLAMPLILLIVFNKKIDVTTYNMKQKKTFLSLTLIAYVFGLAILIVGKSDINSLGYLYYNVSNQSKVIDNFGILTATKVDLKRVATKFEEKIILDGDLVIDEVLPEDFGFNEVLNLDELIENESNQNLLSMHKYFDSIEATNKNIYTGKFEGKNLIFILAEGFNSIAVSEELTPTLYKMVNSSFVFENFYSPVFLSTTGGEFQATTGLIPTMSILNTYTKTKPLMSYGLGNAFKKEGYSPYSYHNWTYTYYKRNISMSALGFDNYIGCNNGMEKLINCKWLPSDIDMMKKTVPIYAGEDKFVTYYVTVSGHAPYVLGDGNSIAKKNRDLVLSLPFSNDVKAYIATQIELDLALETMLAELDASGKLDDTVIALVGDHYPYTLSMNDINSISTHMRDDIIEVNRSNFILWSNDTEKTLINKVGSQIDVLPTLLNLFGIEYDSRLLVGKDILSDASGLAIFSNRSWVSDKGHYYSRTGKFVPKDGVKIEEDYVSAMNVRVANSFTISEKIINNKYYEKTVEVLED